MRITNAVVTLVTLCGILLSSALADDKQTTKFDSKIAASGPLKAYKGPEGETIVMVPINDDKQMLVHMKGIGGDLEGKTLRYLFEELSDGSKNVYLDWKRGSKPYRKVLLSARDNSWEFYYPGKNKTLTLSYSEAASEKFKVEDIIKAIKP